MTKKDYKALARAFETSRERVAPGQRAGIDAVAIAVAMVATGDNPRFSVRKFLWAAGLNDSAIVAAQIARMDAREDHAVTA